MVAATHFPASLDEGLLDRVRRPLAAIAALLLVADLIGLGLHLADAGDSPFSSDSPAPARTRIGGPEAVVPGSEVLNAGTQRESSTSRASEPYGCLSASSGCYAGPAASPPSGETSPGTTSPGETPTAPQPPPPVPVAQAGVAAPALGAQVSVGVGDGSCTTVDLTVIALGDCPQVTGDGPVVVNVGGSLLGD